MKTAKYKLDQQAVATRVQERSSVPAMTLPVFSEAEVQSVFISTANCIGMATMVCPVTYIAQRMVPAHHAGRCGRCCGQVSGTCSQERVLTIPVLYSGLLMKALISALMALCRTSTRKAGGCWTMAPGWWPAQRHSKPWQ